MNQPYRTYTPTKRNNITNQTTPPSSAQSYSNSKNKSNQVPFRPGFQPRGIYRDRTDELIKLRNSKQESKRLQESRLQKRLEKLIQLHFPIHSSENLIHPSNSIDNSSNSSILNLSNTLIGIAKNFTNQTNESNLNLINSNQNLKIKEQSIVRWQDDKEVKECKFCQTKFGLRVRKHHCRLCGSVVCFNPTWITGKNERCSTMIRFEWNEISNENQSLVKKNQNEKVIQAKIIQLTEQELGSIDQTHSSLLDLISNPTHTSSKPNNSKQYPTIVNQPPKNAVRICSLCLTIVLRRQAMTSPPQIPHYLLVYSNLKRVQDEIQHALPEFQEFINSSNHSGSDMDSRSGKTSSTSVKMPTIKKKLLTNLSLFDSYTKELTKKLIELQSSQQKNNNKINGENGSEIRLIKAITTRAGLFLRDHMSLINSLGLLDSHTNSNSSNSNLKKNKNLNLNQDSKLNQSPKPLMVNKNNKTQELIIPHQHERNLSSDSRILESNQNNNNPYYYDDDNTGGSGSDNQMNQELIKLNVLLEQENLIESYLFQASQSRQLEDVASLTINLNDLREEISNLKKILL